MAQTARSTSTLPSLIDHGRKIFIYIHARTNQVVYSLQRTLHPGIIQKQLPFTGKNSLPAPSTMRKDMWRPLATVYFPTGRQGLDAFHQLREFRKRHEYEREENDSLQKMQKRERGRVLRDQKANTVADLAAVMVGHEGKAEVHAKLAAEEQGTVKERLDGLEARIAEALKVKAANRTAYMSGKESVDAKTKYKDAKREVMKLKAEIKALRHDTDVQVMPLDAATSTQDGSAPQGTVDIEPGKRRAMFSMDGVRIQWADIANAEFADTWPASVVHDTMPMGGPRERHVHSSGEDAAWVQAEKPAAQQEVVVVERAAPKRGGMKQLVDRLRFGRQ